VEHVHKLTLTTVHVDNWNLWFIDLASFLSTNRINALLAIACKKTASGDALVYLEDHLRELKTYGKKFSGDAFIHSAYEEIFRRSDGVLQDCSARYLSLCEGNTGVATYIRSLQDILHIWNLSPNRESIPDTDVLILRFVKYLKKGTNDWLTYVYVVSPSPRTPRLPQQLVH
jgi:hypothetical protein